MPLLEPSQARVRFGLYDVVCVSQFVRVITAPGSQSIASMFPVVWRLQFTCVDS